MIQIKEKRKFNDLVTFEIEDGIIKFTIQFNDGNYIYLDLPIDSVDNITHINQFGINKNKILND